jgi:predicted N-acetyltransferase YhbS
MSHTITSCRPDEILELVELANRIFRGRRPGDMGAEYPLLICAENCEQLRVARADGRLVAHVGICIRDAVILGAPLRVASIGAVCTDPDYRGRGIASDLMADAAAHSRARGASLMLISGGRGLYHRLGYVTVGRFNRYQAPSGDLAAGLELAPLGEDDLDAVIALHQREPVRFLRPREDWERLLAAGMLMNHRAELLLARQEGVPVAYLAVREPASSSAAPEVLEFAGSRGASAAVLPAVAARAGADRAHLVALADDREMEIQARARAFTARAEPFPGTLGVLDPRRFLDAIRVYLAERLGGDATGLSVEVEGEQVAFRRGDEAVAFGNMGRFTAFLFGGDTEEARAVPQAPPGLARLLGRAFPMPLLWYGYNYV